MCPWLGEFCSISFSCFCLFDPVRFSSLARDSAAAACFSCSQILVPASVSAGRAKFFEFLVLAASRFPVQRFGFADRLRDFLHRRFSVVVSGSPRAQWPGSVFPSLSRSSLGLRFSLRVQRSAACLLVCSADSHRSSVPDRISVLRSGFYCRQDSFSAPNHRCQSQIRFVQLQIFFPVQCFSCS
jgi:hypothetical protein